MEIQKDYELFLPLLTSLKCIKFLIEIFFIIKRDFQKNFHPIEILSIKKFETWNLNDIKYYTNLNNFD